MSRRWCVSLRARLWRRLVLAAFGAAALVVGQVISGISVGFTLPVAAAATTSWSSHPNRYSPAPSGKVVNHLPAPPVTPKTKPTASPPRIPPVPMKAALVPLDPAAGAHFVGSDGVLELSVPAGAVTAADVKAAGGGLSLLVRQVLPPSGSNAGGSGHYTLGTWLVQVVDTSGKPAASGLRQKLGVKLHDGSRTSALDLDQVLVNVNAPLPSWVDLNPASVSVTPASSARQQAPVAPSAKPALGAASHQKAVLDAAASTLSAAVLLSSPSTAVSFDTFAPVATFGRPDPFETDLSAGALSAGIQLDLPAGPGGLTPPLQLVYNSSGVSDQHNPQGAAPWVGEGWSLGLGAISWAEHNVEGVCETCTTPKWEDSWQLSDPYGTAADLVPQNTNGVNVVTYNEDSGRPITPSPVTWHTAPETRAKVISFQSPSPPSPPPGGWNPVPPCFRVFLPSGIMEEFGCTPDSLQFYRPASGTTAGEIFLSSWLLDLITDPQGNQVHVTYQQDMESGFNGQGYPRDIVPATLEWDSPGCHSQQTACTGGNWTPLMRVSFAATHSVAHVSSSSCAATGNLRCDDPVDLSGNGGVPAPLIQSTFVLDDAAVQVRSGGSAGWSTLRDYQFSYDQGPASTIAQDPESGTQESVAGKLLLTRLQETGADGATALPPRTFAYSTMTQYYEDSLGAPKPLTNCGPSWNNGNSPNHTGCILWSQSYDGNSSYLTTVSNGQGLSESFQWALARNNDHGVVSGSNADPFACNNGSVQGTYPCNMADDETWSRAVLTQRQDSVVQVTQSGQGGTQTRTTVTSTWNYSYQVRTPLPAPCNNCVASFYWGNENDFDLLDFYNNRFMGFAQANVGYNMGLPGGSVEVHKFHTTEGFGTYDPSQVTCDPIDHNHTCVTQSAPWSDVDNAAHGHEYELDRYDTDGSTLQQQAKTKWAAVCPPPGVTGTPSDGVHGNWNGNLVAELDLSNPMMVCEVHPVQVDKLTYDGTGTGPVPDQMTTYSYDNLGRVASQTTRNTTGVFDLSGHANHAIWSGGVGFGQPSLVSGDSDTAASFDGSTGSVGTPVVNQQVLTVEAWFQLSSLPSGSNPRLVASSHTDVDFKGFQMAINSGGAGGFVDVATTQGVFAVPWSQQLAVGTSYHYVMTYDGFNVKAYLNGTQMGSTPAGGAVVPSLLPVTIGRDPAYSSNDWFGGTLDEVAIYSTALSAARVQAHFGAGSGYQAAVQADSPLGYYRLDDGRVGTASPNTIVSSSAYIQNDGVVASATGANGPYLIDRTALGATEDTGGNRYQCAYQMYDGQAWATGQQPSLTQGELTNKTSFTSCGTPAQGFADRTDNITTTNA